jgi:hypothetical protein
MIAAHHPSSAINTLMATKCEAPDQTAQNATYAESSLADQVSDILALYGRYCTLPPIEQRFWGQYARAVLKARGLHDWQMITPVVHITILSLLAKQAGRSIGQNGRREHISRDK